ncbi:hypothetical protein [Candidatus Midichloria mitochondrii]
MPENKELANVLRALSLDMVESENSGHPGLPLVVCLCYDGVIFSRIF